MSIPKVPNQFPWIVAGVVVVHAILAVFLFGRGRDTAVSIPIAQTTTSDSPSTPPVDEASGPVPTAVVHPLADKKNFTKEDNLQFESRFPKRVPLLSEFNNSSTPATEEVAVQKPEDTTSEAAESDQPAEKRTGETQGSTSILSAVAAAKAAPFSSSKFTERITEPETPGLPASANRIRIIETPAPVPVPRPIAVENVSKTPEPVSQVRTTGTRKIEPIEPIERAATPRLKTTTEMQAEARPENPSPPPSEKRPPVQPESGRRFRVVKPLPR